MPTLKDIAYNCRQATYLIEKKQFGSISLKEHLQLRYHLTGCSVCRIYQKQSIYISQVLQNNYARFTHSQLALGNEFKAALQERINLGLINKKGK
jgi:hypothetical protein